MARRLLRSPLARPAAVAAWLAFGLGCAQSGPVVPWPTGQGTLRFIDHLEAAEISSPLLDLPAVPPLEELRGDAVWGLGEAVRRWRPSGSDLPQEGARGCIVDSAGSVACSGEFEVYLQVAIEPNTYYRLEVAGVATPEGCAEPELIEQGYQAHRLPVTPAGASTTWRGGRGGGRLLFVLRPRRPDLTCAVDSLRVEVDRLTLDTRMELALIAQEDLLEEADVALGMAKRGALLPATAARFAKPPWDENYSLREALFAPTPARIRFRVRLPPRARLRLGYGLHRASRSEDDARFEVRLSPRRGKDVVLVDERLWAYPTSWYWRDRVLDLDPWAGQEVEIALVTRSGHDRPVYALWASPTIEVPREAGDPPNVVLVAIDTLRADRLGSLGHPGGLSPHLDALARDGVLFRQAISPGNWTLPAFVSLFTGQGAHEHAVLRHTDAVEPAATTVAEALRRAGWATEAILYKPTLYLGNRLEQGFERYFNVPIVAPRGDRNLEKAFRWLQANGDRRFFLFVHFNDPHQPITIPPESLPPDLVRETERFRIAGRQVDLGDAFATCRGCFDCAPCGEPGFEGEFMAMGKALYDREVAYVDDCVGRLVAELRRLGLYEEAVVALVSDHGETLWEHDEFYGHGGPNFRDELVRVPLIVKPPAGTGPAPGTVVASQVSTADLAPTLLELAGLPTAETGVAGGSLSRFWRSAAGAASAAPVFSLGSQGESVRRAGFKYMREIVPGGGGEEWLFDLARDPGEDVDAAAREPGRFEELRSLAVEQAALQGAGGALILVRGAASVGADELLLTWSPAARRRTFAHFGLSLETCAASVCGYRGAPRGRLALADLFDASREATVEVALSAAGRSLWQERLALAAAAPLTAGAVARFAAGDGPGALVLWAPPARAAPPAAGEAQVLSAEQVEALRALGYLDD